MTGHDHYRPVCAAQHRLGDAAVDQPAQAGPALAPALAAAAAFHGDVTLLRAIHTLTAAEIERLDKTEPGLGQLLTDAQINEAED